MVAFTHSEFGHSYKMEDSKYSALQSKTGGILDTASDSVFLELIYTGD